MSVVWGEQRGEGLQWAEVKVLVQGGEGLRPGFPVTNLDLLLGPTLSLKILILQLLR